jgi:ADP-ribose pyrophosphatase
VLLDLHTSPGFSDELVRVYLARGLSEAPHPPGFVVEDEELDMTVARVPLDDAVARVLAGEITNAAAAAGIAATALARDRGWHGLRPAELSWPERRRR